MHFSFHALAPRARQTQWYDLCTRISPLLPADTLLNRILHAYSEPQRFYHITRHLVACLHELENVRNLLHSPDAVEWALWFHDIIYNPHAPDNEEQSAHISESILYEARVEPSFIERTTELILATRHSNTQPDSDTSYLVDIDLTILGSNPAVFAEYEENIRREYAWVPEVVYRTKRKEILATFLHRPTIYHTAFFHGRYEQQARENLQWSIEQLSEE